MITFESHTMNTFARQFVVSCMMHALRYYLITVHIHQAHYPGLACPARLGINFDTVPRSCSDIPKSE